MRDPDVIVIGAGAAGMMCAIEAGRRGRRVLVLEHNREPGEKIRISGGGRCNFTNLGVAANRFISGNPKFALSALKRFDQHDFIAMVDAHGIAWHEKTLGQLFCDGSSRQIIDMLTGELREAGVEMRTAIEVESVERIKDRFVVSTSEGVFMAEALVVAAGGKSIPKMGASGFGYRIAQQFGLKLRETRPGLVPLTFEPGFRELTADLSGVGIDVSISGGGVRFREAMLFTHRGLSGPAVLQISNHWREGEEIIIDLMPDGDPLEALKSARKDNPRQQLATALSGVLPKRLAQHFAEGEARRIGEIGDKDLIRVGASLREWRVKPTGSEGYRTAEVTLGGVDTDGLNAKTLQAKAVPGLYFIGEVVDVTGWLGGYNFQWAWSSGWAAGQVA
ncbi:BaiN/RdsA family NAD(P)/FAD-dependent oxidoreductase [Cucumibacter marinus]|uniref:NAD(P)/FAD-dependent oxidoreductase n=1 Tax=Cucumibacter marinus TaxID=1121252 RepID=UPI0004256C57|nr:NAD(P)/FAD-dependent oxidoreductase [Cucumibacter marinus]